MRGVLQSSTKVETIPRGNAAWRSMALLAAVFLLGSGIASAGVESTVEGVLHIKNGATPSQGIETLQLEELWRAGGEDDETFFGLISQVVSDSAGNIYLLDTQLSEVYVYSPDGEQIKTLSRQGEGPGETNNPFDMLFLPDGTLGLVQMFPGKIVKLDLEGNPAGTFTVGGNDPTQGSFAILIDAKQKGDNLVLGGIRMSVDQAQGTQTMNNFLASFSNDGEEKVRYIEKTTILDFADFKMIEKDQYFVFRHWAVGPDGRVHAAPFRDSYAIHVYKADGTLERVVAREFTNWKRTEEDLARANSMMEAQTRRIPMEVETKVEDTEPAISSLHIAPNGNLWVQHSRSNREQPEGILVTYDVFDPQGHFIKQVAVPCDGDGVRDGLIFCGDDRIIQVTGFLDALVSLQGGGAAESDDEEEPEPMEVICYAIKK